MCVCEREKARERGGEAGRYIERLIVAMEGAERLMGVVLRAIVSLHCLSGHIVYAWGHICSRHRHSLHTPRDTARLFVCVRVPVHRKVHTVSVYVGILTCLCFRVRAHVFVFMCVHACKRGSRRHSSPQAG